LQTHFTGFFDTLSSLRRTPTEIYCADQHTNQAKRDDAQKKPPEDAQNHPD
jgi:hypothetical protein